MKEIFLNKLRNTEWNSLMKGGASNRILMYAEDEFPSRLFGAIKAVIGGELKIL
jgi:hypothetical protein